MGFLEDNVTLITGAGSGLGRAIVARFIAEGARVAVLEVSAEKAAQLEADFGETVHVIVGDVTRSADNERAVSETVGRFGRLDTFIGNAGIWDFNMPLLGTSGAKLADAFDQLFSVNVKGYLLGARAAADTLAASNGSMIFTLSNASFFPGGGGPLYTASKHAGVGLVRQLAYELDGRVRVNAVAPGGMATDLRGVPAFQQAEMSIGKALESVGGPDAVAAMLHKPFFPVAEDYVVGYLMLASR